MRNLKKILALVLALVMSMSLMATANAFTDDASIDADYEVAAKVLADMGIFKGYPDGSFQPTAAITRQEVAAIMYRISSADVTDKQAALYVEGADFTDVKATDWSAGYIGFCANGGIVVGNGDGTFGPQAQVTGYQVLAMALRAVGYDKNGEFTGADWAKNVATTAQSLGILKNVPGTVQLSKPATRELVAELVFQTIATVSQVEYTPAFGYQPVKVWAGALTTLGYEQFKLTAEATQDVWGRPGTKYTYNVGEKATTILDKAVYTATVAVDECDVAKALGLTKAAGLEKAFIDGEEYNIADAKVTSNQKPTIDPWAYTSKMGAQGRQLEIYKMGTTYRVVEINTYLAQVTGVTASKVDKNGHVTDASIALNVYFQDGQRATAATFKTTGYAVGDYALVTLTTKTAGTAIDAVKSVSAVAPTAGGTKTGWTGTTTGYGTTTIATTTYADSDKFILENAKSASAKNWDVIVDAYGNLIGLVESTKSYLTIEAARWIDVDHTLYGGYVLANIYLADGTHVENVKIAKVIDDTTLTDDAVKNADNSVGVIADASFSDVTALNDVYANHLYAYSIDANGNYVIDTTNAGTDLTAKKVTISTKGTYMADDEAVVPVNDNTVFMVADAGKTTYTTYVGKDNVPNLTEATVCYLTNGTYATTVLVTEYKLAANTFLAYTEATSSNTYVAGKGYAFTVYKIGETTPTTVYYATSDFDTTYDLAGIFEFTVNGSNVASAVVAKAYDANDYDALTIGTKKYENAKVTALKGLTLITDDAKFWMNNAKYITLTYTTSGTAPLAVAEAAITDIAVNDQVIVVYTGSGELQFAEYVYILKADGTQGAGAGADNWRTGTLDGVVYTWCDELEKAVVTDTNVTLKQMSTSWGGAPIVAGYYTTTNGIRTLVELTHADNVTVASILAADGGFITMTANSIDWTIANAK